MEVGLAAVPLPVIAIVTRSAVKSNNISPDVGNATMQTFGKNFVNSICFPNDMNPPVAFRSSRLSFTGIGVGQLSALEVVDEATSPSDLVARRDS